MEEANKVLQKNLVLVEDDVELSRLTMMLLESEGFMCHPIYNGNKAVDGIAALTPDIVVLDVMLPGKSGVDICAEIREFYDEPILMLTGCDDDITELTSLRTGADDYIVKPIKPHLLVARVHALLRRGNHKPQTDPKTVQSGDIVINTSRREVLVGQKTVELTSAEFDLLILLVDQAGAVISREECCRKLRGFDYDGVDRSIDMRVSSLRKKITPFLNGKQGILTVRNRGYMLSEGNA